MSPGPRATRSDDDEEPFVSFDGEIELADVATGVEAIGAAGFVTVAGTAVSLPAGEAPLVLSVADS